MYAPIVDSSASAASSTASACATFSDFDGLPSLPVGSSSQSSTTFRLTLSRRCLHVDFAMSLSRAAERDDMDPDPAAPSNRRYVVGQLLYLDQCRPADLASIVIDNNSLGGPRITRPTTQPRQIDPTRGRQPVRAFGRFEYPTLPFHARKT